MKKEQPKREQIEGACVCLTCGNVSNKWVTVGDKGIPSKTKCPKCSKTAYTLSIAGIWGFMPAVAKEISRMKLDMLDVQAFIEEQMEGPTQ